MAVPHGSNAHLSIDGNTVSIYTDTTSMDKTVETAETTAFTLDDKAYIAGLRDVTFTCGGPWDAALDAFAAAWDDSGTVPIIFGPDSNTSGRVRYTFSAFLTGYTPNTGVGERVSWSATFQRTGATTRDTF